MKIQLADALIVHGHGLTPDLALDSQTSQRMDTAISAWHEGVAPVMAVSGGHSFMLRTPPPQAEATVMKSYALQHGIPEEDIFVEDQSLDTIGNSVFTKTTLVLPNEWERLTVVTSEYHLPRTLKVHNHVLGNDFEIRGIAAPEQIGLKQKMMEPIGALMVREVLRGTKAGDHEAIQQRLFDLVPGYGTSTSSRLAMKSLTGILKKS